MDLFSAQTYEAVRRPLLEAETLPPACYTSEEFFKREVETIFMREWNFIGRADYIAKSGDYYTVDFVGVPLLVMRGADGHVRAFVNSCRHRGAKVAQGEGNARKAIKCPYHGWVYGLDGELLGCAGMKATKNFDPADFPLLSVKTALWGGFIFINFDAEGESLESFLGDITTVFESYHLENMVCTQRKHYDVPCNWKIYVENAMEAFHVPHVHRASINRQRGSVRNDRTFDPTHGNWVVMHKEHEGTRAVLMGDQSFPRIAGLEGKADKGTFYPLIFPSTMLGCTVDCMWFLEIHPLTATTMRLIVGACFPQEITQREDFDSIAVNYYKRWDMTTQEDIDISVLQQQGIASPLSRAGRLSEHEPLIHAIDNWVLDHVLGVERPTRRYQGFSVQDLDVLPENMVA
jgi:phenylpropionate dioxygenase-like ring-hydroxylating dioxygenase large terminal subunit